MGDRGVGVEIEIRGRFHGVTILLPGPQLNNEDDKDSDVLITNSHK